LIKHVNYSPWGGSGTCGHCLKLSVSLMHVWVQLGHCQGIPHTRMRSIQLIAPAEQLYV